jgi:hypothetical protein
MGSGSWGMSTHSMRCPGLGSTVFMRVLYAMCYPMSTIVTLCYIYSYIDLLRQASPLPSSVVEGWRRGFVVVVINLRPVVVKPRI